MDKAELATWAQRTGKSEEELQQEFEALKSSEIIAGINDPKLRELEATRVLKARYARILISTGQDKDFIVMILRKGSVRKVPVERDGVKEDRPVLNVFGFGRKADGGEFQYIRMAAWGDEDINSIGILEPYTVYKVNLKDKGNGQCTITVNSKWVKDKVMKPEMALTTLRKLLPTVPFTEYDSAIANGKTHYIEGSVIRHYISEKDGRKIASYTIIPSDMTSLEDQIQTQGLTVWVDPEMVKYGDDSLLHFVGKLIRSKTGAPALSADVVVPIIDYPLTTTEDIKPEEKSDPFSEATPAPTKSTKPTTQPTKPSKPATPPPQKKVEKKKEDIFDNVKILQPDEDPFS